jgi:Starch-binding associating with outer membrane
MRLSKLGFAGAGAAIAIAMTGCNADKLASINHDPNNPTSAPPKAVFTYAARIAAGRWFGAAFDLRRTEFTTQQLAEVQYPDEDAYRRVGAADTDGDFIGVYSGELKNFQAVADAGKADDQPLLYGPALIMRSLIFSYVTDMWGDVPYSQALQGDGTDAVITPVYDAQKDIYTDLFKVLGDAVTALDGAPSSAISLASADAMYGGNKVKWERFANSIRARLAMRLANVDAATAKTQLQAAIAAPGGLMLSNADNANFPWPGDGIYDNPWSANFRTRDDHRMSNTLMNQMLPVNDPRVSIYAQPTVANQSVYAGMPNALTQSGASAYFTSSSRPGAVFYGATVYSCPTCGARTGAKLSSFVLSFAEVSFILAEAAERGWIAGNAASLYEQGIRASMDQWGVTSSSAVDAFLANAAIAYKGGTAGLKQIALQKWIALFSNGVEAYSEWRRTCVPETVKPGPDAIEDHVPRRYKYSIRESSVNAANMADAVSRMGGDEFSTRMYWDTNPTAAPTYPGASCGAR